MVFSEKLLSIAKEAEKELADIYGDIEKVSLENTAKVLSAFRNHRVSDSMFQGTTGYGYDDVGREALEKIYADVFGGESALVRHSIANGTHAISIALFGLLRPGDIMLSVTNRPYDTLCSVVGMNGANGDGSLADFGVGYDQVDFRNGKIDFDGIEEKIWSKPCK